MDVNAIVQTLKWRLSRFTSTGALTDEMVITELNLAQTRMEHKAVLPWFLLSNMASEDLQVGQERVQLPDRFLVENDESDLWLVDPEGVRTPLKKTDYDSMRNKYTKGGTPKEYAIVGRYFYLRPVIDAPGYKIEMIYFKGAPEIIAGGPEGDEWLRHYPDLLIAEAGRVLAEFYLKMPQASTAFGLLRTEAYDDMIRRETFRETTQRDPTPED